MRLAFHIAAVCAFALSAGHCMAASELCHQLKSFARAPLTELADGGLQRRWIDFAWGGPENLAPDEIRIGATLKCQGSDAPANSLCQYLLHHTPHETVSALPQGILRCEGFASDRLAFPRRWVEELSWDVQGKLIEMLQIDQFDRPGTERSLRLTILPLAESPQATKPVPFFRSLSGKLGSDDSE
ncbi:hypothetical protein [Novosphingobium olei]|uniref:hypothetical protein n=1 Tax=Novosphingobium olei TaxID=2728851 RepID=UPI003087A3C6|nr:hypothetical protein NSDW_25710 [Novosphingobium olei]